MLQKKPICTHLHLCVLPTRQGSAALSLLISGTPSMSTSYCSALRTLSSVRGNSKRPFLNGKKQKDCDSVLWQYFLMPRKHQGKYRNPEGCKQLPTKCCFFIQASNWLVTQIFIPTFCNSQKQTI